MSLDRQKVRFDSGGETCVAWHYPGGRDACVIMAAGLGVTKEPGTDLFAARFQRGGFHVLAFDYRRFGESTGQPRQVVRVAEQIADWSAAVTFAATLPGVDPRRLAAWGFSTSGGHVLRVAARTPGLAAAIAQTPIADGTATSRNASGYQSPAAMARVTARATADALGGLIGRPPRLMALDGPRGAVALLTTPDTADSERALDPEGRHTDWPRTIAARAVLSLSFYRPGRDAARITCPLLVVVCDEDRSAPLAPTETVVRKAPRGELVTLPGGHYAPFLDAHDKAAEAEIDFLTRHLIGPAAA